MKKINQSVLHFIKSYKLVASVILLIAPIITQAAVTLNFVQSDHLGTPRTLSDSTGDTVWQLTQTPFGETTIDQDPDGDGNNVVANLRFPGQYYDDATKLNYNWNRYYNTGLGRYMTSDPIGLGDGPNTYLYAQANPLRFTDPTGEFVPALIWGGLWAYRGYQFYRTSAVTAGLVCLAAGCGTAIGELLSEIWGDGDDIPDSRYGGYDQTDEDLAVALADNLTGGESCEVIAEAITALNNRIRGRQENIDDEHCGMGDDGHNERIEILEDRRDRLEEALSNGRCI